MLFRKNWVATLALNLLLVAFQTTSFAATTTVNKSMELPRSSGILLHISSLPSKNGIGDFGESAYRFVDILKEKKQSFWQVLPLVTPDGFGSPYASMSAFAGSPYLISPEILVKAGLLANEDLNLGVNFNEHKVERSLVQSVKSLLLQKAYENYKKDPAKFLPSFNDFKAKNNYWLDDYSMFITFVELEGTDDWRVWDPRLALRDATALAKAKQTYSDRIEYHKFVQYVFYSQWMNLKQYANSQGISLIGDIPIFVSLRSADVWAHPDMFQLDSKGYPLYVAGVPPDCFAVTGQLWGNPVYNWENLEKSGYSWWIDRFRMVFSLYDKVRVDHFIGFYNYWRIPGQDRTAQNGTWTKAGGDKLFTKVQEVFGKNLPIIAEDLGKLTQGVIDLRDKFNFPGMKVALLGYGSDETDPNFKDNYDRENAVIYTGTHDNDTSVGWYNSLKDGQEKSMVEKYVGLNRADINWYFIEMIMNARPNLAITPLQDILGLGTEARMNLPGAIRDSNWAWRFTWNELDPQALQKYENLVVATGRANGR